MTNFHILVYQTNVVFNALKFNLVVKLKSN